jgi:hypothetical protein
MTMSGVSNSAVVTLFFSGFSTAGTTSGSVSGIGWGFDPTTFNPFPPQITGGDVGHFNFIAGSASITINGSTQSMDGVFLQDSSNSPGGSGLERFGTTGFLWNVSPGATFSWTGTAVINISGKGLTFSDLNPGSTGTLLSFPGNVGGKLVVVPEPSSACLLAAFAAVSWTSRRRRRSC